MDYFIHSLFLVSLSTNIAGNQVRGISRFFSLRRGRGGWISGVRVSASLRTIHPLASSPRALSYPLLKCTSPCGWSCLLTCLEPSEVVGCAILYFGHGRRLRHHSSASF